MSVPKSPNTSAAIPPLPQTDKTLLHHPLAKALLPFINGGLAGMTATAVVQPIDMVKVRIQLTPSSSKPTFLSVFNSTVKNEGFARLYKGLSAGLLRQAIYTTTRFGLFHKFTDRLKARAKAQDRAVHFGDRSLAALGAGGIAAAVGNPADLALIRMQSDGLKPAAERANYRNVVDAMRRIVAAEGLGALWGGAYPTIVRAMLLNFGQLATYDQAKSSLEEMTSWGPGTVRFTSSAIAGFFGSAMSLPADFVKTRLQKQGKNGEYRGMWDCAVKTWKAEGIGRFYKGFGTYYVRIAPHAMISLLVMDFLKAVTQ